jgi:hypothetical protein
MMQNNLIHYFEMLYDDKVNKEWAENFDSESLLKFFYGTEVTKPSVNLLLKILQIADYLHLVKNIETALSIYLNSTIKSMQFKDLVSLYKLLKEEYSKYEGLYDEILGTTEQVLSTNIKEVIVSKHLLELPKDLAVHLLNKGLEGVSDNDLLGVVLEELKSYMKASSFFHMLTLVS